MDEKRCEWCGTLSPADAEKCILCRIAFGVPVPPPRDWSELTGNIPVITAPLLEEPARANAASRSGVPAASPTSPTSPTAPAAPVSPGEYHVPAQAAPAPAEKLPPVTAPAAATPVTAEVAAPVTGVELGAVTPSLAEAAVEPLATPTNDGTVDIPGWRAPDDPTLRVFADRLEERERRRSSSRTPARRRRRRLLRLMVWLLALGLIAAALVLAQARLPFGA